MDDYYQEAYGPTAEDAARCGVEDMVVDAFENGDITKEQAKRAFANIAEKGGYIPFNELYV